MQRCESLSTQGAPPFDSFEDIPCSCPLRIRHTRACAPAAPFISRAIGAGLRVCQSTAGIAAIPSSLCNHLLRERLPAGARAPASPCIQLTVHARLRIVQSACRPSILCRSLHCRAPSSFGIGPDEHVPHAPHALASHAVHAWFSERPHAAPPFAAACATVLLRSRLPFEHALQLPQGFALQSPHDWVSLAAPQASPPFAAAVALLLRSRLPLEQALQLPHAFMTQCTHRCESLRAQGAPPFDSLLRTFLVLVLSGFDTRGHVPQPPHLSVVQSAQVCVSVSTTGIAAIPSSLCNRPSCASGFRWSTCPNFPMHSAHSARTTAHRSKCMPPLHSVQGSLHCRAPFVFRDWPLQSMCPMRPMHWPRTQCTLGSLRDRMLHRHLQPPVPQSCCARGSLSSMRSSCPKDSHCSLHTTGSLSPPHRHLRRLQRPWQRFCCARGSHWSRRSSFPMHS